MMNSNRMLSELQLGEFIYEQPALGDSEYIFKHALTQEVSYNSVLLERRKQLHERIGAALEKLYANSIDDHLDELAHHYSRSGSALKALEYYERVGRQAAQRSAYTEAVRDLSAAVELLKSQPESPERDQRELGLQTSLGPLLMITKGWAAAETGRVYLRAHGWPRPAAVRWSISPRSWGCSESLLSAADCGRLRNGKRKF